MSFRPRDAGPLVRRTESRKPVTTELVDIGHPLNGSAGTRHTRNAITALLWSYGGSTNELGEYWFPALGRRKFGGSRAGITPGPG